MDANHAAQIEGYQIAWRIREKFEAVGAKVAPGETEVIPG